MMHLGDHAIIDVECYEGRVEGIKRCRRVLLFLILFLINPIILLMAYMITAIVTIGTPNGHISPMYNARS